jgi:hypothetical protein
MGVYKGSSLLEPFFIFLAESRNPARVGFRSYSRHKSSFLILRVFVLPEESFTGNSFRPDFPESLPGGADFVHTLFLSLGQDDLKRTPDGFIRADGLAVRAVAAVVRSYDDGFAFP